MECNDYLFFLADKEYYGDHKTIGEHLDHVSRLGDAPDCWMVHYGLRSTAIKAAKNTGKHLYIVNECS